jgi:CRP-like cAMP-binding protein
MLRQNLEKSKQCSIALQAGTPIRNRLLHKLPPWEFEQLRQHLHPVELRRRQMLVEANFPLRFVYFIEEGAACVLCRPKFDCTMDVGMIGHLGMVGIPAVLETQRSPFRCVVQVPGSALRMDAAVLQNLLKDCPELRRRLLGYVQARMVQQAQLIVCNTRHRLHQRVARWILMALDRLESDEIVITHEALSRMLGARRAGISVALNTMEKAHVLRLGRGRIRVVNSNALEALACNCHRFIQAEYSRLWQDKAPTIHLPQ